jgi:hypothetical protein
MPSCRRRWPMRTAGHLAETGAGLARPWPRGGLSRRHVRDRARRPGSARDDVDRVGRGVARRCRARRAPCRLRLRDGAIGSFVPPTRRSGPTCATTTTTTTTPTTANQCCLQETPCGDYNLCRFMTVAECNAAGGIGAGPGDCVALREASTFASRFARRTHAVRVTSACRVVPVRVPDGRRTTHLCRDLLSEPVRDCDSVSARTRLRPTTRPRLYQQAPRILSQWGVCSRNRQWGRSAE